ncbi:MbtH family protein [Streptomyces sp. NPDC090109]|uniref:MbtH family protein n=1 Tax=unclassified Streptomyces TaxID=2593676 RepID=UPI000EF84F0B|nr:MULTISPECIES: MbtH family protein [unclassified Streptomyces]MZE56618.1 MbtH family NRPS accessory protein [Streptomyces sp. SID5770]
MTTENTGTHLVVRNHELQYSLWPVERELPAGWEPDGFRGDPQECLDHIEGTWTDMRPLSARTSGPTAVLN